MQTKLTLRIDDSLVEQAKMKAHRRGKSVSQMVGDFIGSLDDSGGSGQAYPPITSSLTGILRESSETDYKAHLLKKHL